jgi:hypothetical protein
VTFRVLVSCDSDPAQYAGGEAWPCRAWLTLAAGDPANLAEKLNTAGWRVDGLGGHRCPACTRAIVAQAIAGAST